MLRILSWLWPWSFVCRLTQKGRLVVEEYDDEEERRWQQDVEKASPSLDNTDGESLRLSPSTSHHGRHLLTSRSHICVDTHTHISNRSWSSPLTTLVATSRIFIHSATCCHFVLARDLHIQGRDRCTSPTTCRSWHCRQGLKWSQPYPRIRVDIGFSLRSGQDVSSKYASRSRD